MTMASPRGVHHTTDAKHTDVIIIGNGPSAISLSYMLSGNLPFYNGATLSNEYLEQRLKDDIDTSLFEQDLSYLSDGLEGRSNNPVALLFDQLFHPDADQGIDSPSAIEWRTDSTWHIPHVVLGKTRPGGSWQNMDGSMQTISQNSWMELPKMAFKKWLDMKDKNRSKDSDRELVPGRATIADVKKYYTDYVSEQGLQDHFHDFHTVTSVQQVYHVRNNVDSESGEVEPCCRNVRRNHTHCWEVRGYITTRRGSSGCENGLDTEMSRQTFCYVAPHVVLAVGGYDVPNRLGIEGENLPCVVHSLADYESQISNLRLGNTDITHSNNDIDNFSNPDSLDESQCSRLGSEDTAERDNKSELDMNGNMLQTPAGPDAVLVVGAGLSAADAILTAMEAGLSVIHVFRRSPNHTSLIFTKLPRSMYPEYHRVHRLMKGIETSHLYTPMAKQTVMEVRGQTVLVGSPLSAASSNSFLSSSPPSSGTSLTWINVSIVAIMIGSRSDLSFLPHEGRDLGIVAKWPIDSKHNIMDVDPYSYQSNRKPQMFAMGPLVGDNFVRFGIGASLGIVNHLNKCRRKDLM